MAYQAGSSDGFDRVYAALAGLLHRYLASLVRDQSLADDLVQETFLRIHRSRRTYSPAYPVLPWVFAIARHVYLMNRRASVRRGRHEVECTVETPEPASRSTADAALARDELARALAQVPPDRREAVVLHHIVGLAFRDVARALGISETAAKLRSSRGFANLRRIMVGASRERARMSDER